MKIKIVYRLDADESDLIPKHKTLGDKVIIDSQPCKIKDIKLNCNFRLVELETIRWESHPLNELKPS